MHNLLREDMFLETDIVKTSYFNNRKILLKTIILKQLITYLSIYYHFLITVETWRNEQKNDSFRQVSVKNLE